MSETDPYPHCNATIDLGTRGIHLCYLRAGHSGSHQHNELMVAMVERGALVPNKWDGNLGGGRWVPLKIHQDKLKEQMSNTIAWQMQAEKAADACTLALAERDALRAEVEKLRTENDELRTQADPPSGYCQRCGNLNAGGNHYAMHSEIDGLVSENEKLRAVEKAARLLREKVEPCSTLPSYLADTVTTIAQRLAREAAPCMAEEFPLTDDDGCLMPCTRVTGWTHGEGCSAPLRPAIQSAIEEAIRVCAKVVDKFVRLDPYDGAVEALGDETVLKLLTDDVKDGG